MERKQPTRDSFDNSSQEEFDGDAIPFLGYHEHSKRGLRQWALVLVLITLIISNVGWMWYELSFKQLGHESNSAEPCHSQLKALHWDTPYSSENKTDTNILWRNLFPPGEGLVAISNKEAVANHLPASIKHGGNKSESTYFVAAYHQIHCLSVIRAALYHFDEGVKQTVPLTHTLHCLDSLRQEIMCHADGDLLYTEDGKVFGDGQMRTCRDWEALREWTVQHRI